jgi:hypothetical protein
MKQGEPLNPAYDRQSMRCAVTYRRFWSGPMGTFSTSHAPKVPDPHHRDVLLPERPDPIKEAEEVDTLAGERADGLCPWSDEHVGWDVLQVQSEWAVAAQWREGDISLRMVNPVGDWEVMHTA